MFGAGSQVAAAAGAWLTGIVIARWLGPSGSGAYSLALMLMLTLSALSGAGINTGIAYTASRRSWPQGDAVRQVSLAALGFGVLGGGIGAIAVALLRDDVFTSLSDTALLFALAAVPCSLLWIFWSNLALGFEQYRLYALGPPLQTATGLALACALAGPFGVTGTVLALAASHALTALTIGILSVRAAPAPTPGWVGRTAADLRRAIAFGLKSYAYGALNFLNLRLDVLVLGAVATTSDVGFYAVAVSITGLAPLVPRGLAPVVLARVARLDESSTAAERDLVTQRSLRHATLLLLGTAVVLVVLLAAVPLLYGQAFERATTLGLILMPGVCALGYTGLLTATITGRGRPELTLLAAALVTPPTVALYAFLIPALDANGAAIASTLSYMAMLAVTYLCFRRVTGLEGLRPFLPGRQELRDYGLLARSLRDRGSPVPRADSG